MTKLGRRPKTDWEKCKMADCEKTTKNGAHGFCGTHYMQVRRGLLALNGSPLRAPLRVRSYGTGARCSVEGCGRRPKGQGLCRKHYLAAVKAGTLDPVSGKSVASYTGACCMISSCESRPVNRGMCSKHAQQRMAGILDAEGNQIRDLQVRGRTHLDGPVIDGVGYVHVVAPEGYLGKTIDGRVLEHRLAMEQHLGRLLNGRDSDAYEIVHHKDGDRKNNHISNLELHAHKAHPPGHEVTAEQIRSYLDVLRSNDPDSFLTLLGDLGLDVDSALRYLEGAVLPGMPDGGGVASRLLELLALLTDAKEASDYWTSRVQGLVN